MKQKILGPYRVANREGGKLEVVEMVGDQEMSLRPSKEYDYETQRQAAYGLMARLNRKWQAEHLIVIIKAQGPGPSYAEIKRVGLSMSDPRDIHNHMLLNEQQEQAYQTAYQLVASGDIEAAESELKKCFDWVKVEQ